MSSTVAALIGSVAAAGAGCGGGRAGGGCRARRARVGMALALAGAVDAMLRLVEARGLIAKLARIEDDLRAGVPVQVGRLIEDNRPFNVITDAYAGEIGTLGGDLPFRFARFVTYTAGIYHDVQRLTGPDDTDATKLALLREMEPFWRSMEELGTGLVADLRKAGGQAGPDRPAVREAPPPGGVRGSAPP